MKTSPEAPLRKRILSWIPAALLMGAIFVSSSFPGDEIRLPDFRFSDKVVHFLVYGVLGFLIRSRLVLREWDSPEGRLRGGPDFRGGAAGIFYGASDEIHQAFVPLRESTFSDFAADGLGVAAGVWMGAVAAKRWADKRAARPA